VPAYRSRVVEALADTAKAGTVRATSGGGMEVAMQAGWTSGTGADPSDPLAPPEGTILDVRVCDYVASLLAARDGAPKYRLYWPLAAREQARRAMLAYAQSLR
jgi:hypothetical protein